MKQQIFKRVLLGALCLLFIGREVQAPTSRDADFAEHLTPHNVIMSSLIFHMSELLSTIESYLVGFQKKALIDSQNTLEAIAESSNCSCEKLCEILNIAAYESTYTGGLGIFNLGGPNHNNTDSNGELIVPQVDCWDHALLVNDSNPNMNGVNVIRLQENIVFKPNDQGQCDPTGVLGLAAIVVEKDNMTIDFSGFSLCMDDTNLCSQQNSDDCHDCSIAPAAISKVHGIIIKKGVKNTRIISSTNQNVMTRGSIKDFTGFGIVMEGDTGAGERIEEVYVNNMLIYDCFGGISAEHASNVNIAKTDTNNNCSFDDVYGMRFVNVEQLLVVGSQANSNSSCGDVYGIFLEDTTNGTLQTCETSQNQSMFNGMTLPLPTKGGSAYGIHVTASSATSSSTNHILNCTSNENVCSAFGGAESVGIFLGSTDPASFEGTQNNKVENCIILSNKTLSGGLLAYGIKLDHANFNEIAKNKIGLNLTTGVVDTLQTAPNGSTSIFTSNLPFWNGANGDSNYNIMFRKDATTLQDFSTTKAVTILYAANLQGINTATSMLENFDVRKAQ